MLSIIRRIIEIKTPEEIKIKIYEPIKKEDIIIEPKILLIIKGKLGQYKLQSNFIKIQTDSNRITESFPQDKSLISIIEKKESINNDIVLIERTSCAKRNFLFEKENDKGQIKDKLWEDKKYYGNENKNESFIFTNNKIINYFSYLKKEDENRETNIIKNIDINRKNEGITNKEKKKEKKEEEINKKIDLIYIKRIIKGITQGYTINLESKGIGYQAKISTIEKKEKKEIMGIDIKTSSFSLDKNKINGLDEKINHLWITDNKRNNIKKDGNEKNYRITKIEKNIKRNNEIIEINIKKNFLNNKKILSKIEKKEEVLIIYVGFSHNIIYPLKNKDIKIRIIQRENVTIKIIGIEKKKVNQIAAEIFKIKKPEPYKGKGIRYQGGIYIERKTQRTTKKKT